MQQQPSIDLGMFAALGLCAQARGPSPCRHPRRPRPHPSSKGGARRQSAIAVKDQVFAHGGPLPSGHKTLSLFADDPDLQGWRYGAMLTDLSLPAIEVWNLYRGPTLRLAVARQRRHWFEGLWANAGETVILKMA